MIILFISVFSANKTNAKMVEDWICPTATPPAGARRRTDDVIQDDDVKQLGNFPTKHPGINIHDRLYDTDSAVPVHLVLIIIGCLLLLLIIIGFIAYYKQSTADQWVI